MENSENVHYWNHMKKKPCNNCVTEPIESRKAQVTSLLFTGNCVRPIKKKKRKFNNHVSSNRVDLKPETEKRVCQYGMKKSKCAQSYSSGHYT